jgi:hypothetical protein
VQVRPGAAAASREEPGGGRLGLGRARGSLLGLMGRGLVRLVFFFFFFFFFYFLFILFIWIFI